MKLRRKMNCASAYEDMLTAQLIMSASRMTIDRQAYESCELVVEGLCQGLRSRTALIRFVDAGLAEGRFNWLYEDDANEKPL